MGRRTRDGGPWVSTEVHVRALVSRNDTRYAYSVILSFRHKGLEALFHTGSKKGVQPGHAPKLLRIMDLVNVASCPQELMLPGFRTHELRGDLAGLWSIWVNGNWRVAISFVGEDVELLDYQDDH
ncbi:MAG: type II toxin-antitoxin system RelE/ParE family toxin [Angustibacter sp.]